MKKVLDTKKLKELCEAVIRDIGNDGDVPIGLDWGWANLTRESLPNLTTFIIGQSSPPSGELRERAKEFIRSESAWIVDSEDEPIPTKLKSIIELLAKFARLESPRLPSEGKKNEKGLLYCPFCGEEGQVVFIGGTPYWTPRCSNALCIAAKMDTSWHGFTFEQAHKKWNTRISPSAESQQGKDEK
jgi:hypothetical protein